MGIPNMMVTDLGKALLAKTPTGAALPVTRWQIGKGTLEEGQPLQERTQLLEPVKYIPLAEVKNQGNQCTVTGQLINTGMEAFHWEELGLLATDPDLGEILYAYGNARGSGDLIEAGEEKYREAIFGVELIFDGVANVTAVIDQSLVFIPLSQKGQPGGVASLDETGKVPESQLPNMNYDPAGSAQAVQKNLTAHINNKSNPHGVTAAQAGADPAGSAAAVQAALTPLINAAQSAAIAAMPVGGILWFAGSAAPEGFLVCDGSSFSSSTYPALYSVLKKTTLPNLIDKFVKGSKTVGASFSGSYFMENYAKRTSGNIDYAKYYLLYNPSRTVSNSSTQHSSAYLENTGSGQGTVTSNYKYLEPASVTLLPCIKY